MQKFLAQVSGIFCILRLLPCLSLSSVTVSSPTEGGELAAGGATSSATPTFNKVWQNFLTTRLWPPRGPKKPPAASSAA